jgi:hypothetical protein
MYMYVCMYVYVRVCKVNVLEGTDFWDCFFAWTSTTELPHSSSSSSCSWKGSRNSSGSTCVHTGMYMCILQHGSTCVHTGMCTCILQQQLEFVRVERLPSTPAAAPSVCVCVCVCVRARSLSFSSLSFLSRFLFLSFSRSFSLARARALSLHVCLSLRVTRVMYHARHVCHVCHARHVCHVCLGARGTSTDNQL